MVKDFCWGGFILGGLDFFDDGGYNKIGIYEFLFE